VNSWRWHFSHNHYSARGGLFTGRHIAKTPASDRLSETLIATIVQYVQYDSSTASIHGAQLLALTAAGRQQLVWHVGSC